MSMHTTQMSSLLFRSFTIPFLLLLDIALAPDGLIARAEPSIGSVPSHEKSQSVRAVVAKVRPSVVTIERKNAQSTISLQNPSLPKAVS